MHVSRYPGCSLETAPKDIPFVYNLSTDKKALDHVEVGDPFLRVVLGRESLDRGPETDEPDPGISLLGGVDKLLSTFESGLRSLGILGCSTLDVEWFLLFDDDVANWPITQGIVADSYEGVHDLQSDIDEVKFRRVFQYLPDGALLVAKTTKVDLVVLDNVQIEAHKAIADKYKIEARDRSVGKFCLGDMHWRQMRQCIDVRTLYVDIEPAVVAKCF